MSILDEPTNEYSMRHAANLLNRAFGYGTAGYAKMSVEELETIDFAYQQLHRGANTLKDAQESTEKSINQ